MKFIPMYKTTNKIPNRKLTKDVNSYNQSCKKNT